MRKYKNRHIKKIVRAVEIAYLTTAILWGLATCSSTAERQELKSAYSQGEISKEEYYEMGIQFTEKEEKIFQGIAIGFGLTFVSDVALTIAGVYEEE